jgi:vacuolar-type H+-ATPase subunit E/Vma4
MAESELKRALQREGEADIRGFWQDAEESVSAQRQEINARLEQLNAETDQRLQTEGNLLRSSLLFAARTKAMEGRLHAEAALEKRLLQLARQLLPELTSSDRARLWQALRAELPTADWTSLKVNPADQELAKVDFPKAAIECDEALAGGLVATSADGAIRIDNSLSCRLLRAWPDLLPPLLLELRKQVDNDESADTDTAG